MAYNIIIDEDKRRLKMKEYLVYWVDTDKETGKRYGMTGRIMAVNYGEAYDMASKKYNEVAQVILKNTYAGN
jgi:hypothetical protein